VNATGCTSTGTCAQNGSDNYHVTSLTYSSSTGIFTGYIVTNECPSSRYGVDNGTQSSLISSSGGCRNFTFPATGYTSTPYAAPLLGIAAVSLKGVQVATAMEAGFTTGQVCSASSCTGGVDLPLCQKHLEYECGSSTIDYTKLLDDCGGHASPYHFHKELACDYNKSLIGPHSQLVAIALDGRGIYGYWEANGTAPTDLDACNGHYGPVPAYDGSDGNFSSATYVYHYHLSADAPYTLGCFGPVNNLTQCKSLYSSYCGSGYTNVTTSIGTFQYDTWCPCFRQMSTNETYNLLTPTSVFANSPSSPSSSTTKAPTKAAASASVSWMIPTVISIAYLIKQLL
jgi:hypothetical protein